MTGTPDPRVPSALTGEPQARPAVPDPLHWCVYATVSLLTVILGPAVLVAFSLIALAAYTRAFLGGRRQSRCLLRDTRLVLLYAAATLALGVVATVRGW